MRSKNQCFEAVFVPNTAAGQLRILTGFPRASPKGWRRATHAIYFPAWLLSSNLEPVVAIDASRNFTKDLWHARVRHLLEW